MSEFIFNLSDISASDGNAVVSVNNSDSVFGVVEGSQLFIAGKLPSTILESSTTDSTITLSTPWSQGDVSNVAAKIIPIGTVAELLTALERNRAAYQAFVDAGGAATSEVSWSDILASTLPEFVKRWSSFEEITDKPEHVLGYPSFDKVTGKVAQEQLPDSIETDSKRTQALSPPVKTEPSLSHLLSDYPTLKKTESIPTESPNNRREMLFDDVRELFHVALTDRFLTLPNTVAARKFMVMFSNRYIQLNTAFTGVIEMRVYPLGDGAAGLPTSLTLDNNKWHTFAASVTSLNTIGDGFKGIIDYIRLGNSWETFDSDRSHFSSIDGYYTRSSGDVETPFIDFYLRNDGYWYSADLTPETPQAIGASWAQDGDNKRLYTVTAASDGSDALRFFSDGYDTYEMELILTTNVSGNLALTNGNSDPNIVYYPGTARYFTDDRIYFKRSSGEITGTIEVESIKMRVPNE